MMKLTESKGRKKELATSGCRLSSKWTRHYKKEFFTGKFYGERLVV